MLIDSLSPSRCFCEAQPPWKLVFCAHLVKIIFLLGLKLKLSKIEQNHQAFCSYIRISFAVNYLLTKFECLNKENYYILTSVRIVIPTASQELRYEQFEIISSG